MTSFQIRPLTESDMDHVIQGSGGVRAHPDQDKRSKNNADYKLGSSIIELKFLEEEGFSKPERQEKLATLFRRLQPGRPVIVLDRQVLSQADQTKFDRVVEGPIKTAVAKARRQLKQSREENIDVTCTVLLVINNSYTTLSHRELRELVAHRVRNDTTEIDAVIVAGVYVHGDGIDSNFIWPMDYIPINLQRPFHEYDVLLKGWNELAKRFMTDVVQGRLTQPLEKGPAVDTQFDNSGVTFIRPAPAIGIASDFYVHGRPRRNGLTEKPPPPVAVTFPYLTLEQWHRFNDRLGYPPTLCADYKSWREKQMRATNASEPLKPLVTISITVKDWEAWCKVESRRESMQSVFEYANYRFTELARTLIFSARARREDSVLPERYLLVVTEIIGQDHGNDISHIAIMKQRGNESPMIQPVVENVRIYHEHALALAAAYAVREGIEVIAWSKDLTYAWI